MSLTGCSGKIKEIIDGLQGGGQAEAGEENYEESAVKYKDAAVYHNAYLGFSYAIPKGWWLYERNMDNFSEDPEETADPAGLDILYGEGSEYIELISFGNLQYSNRDNHLGFDISAELVDGCGDIESYMEYFDEFMLEPGENTSYRMLDYGRVDINGAAYERRIFEVIREEESNYNLLTLTRPVKENYFLTIIVSYWPDNKNAETVILNAITNGT
jgi:hypothetical protein